MPLRSATWLSCRHAFASEMVTNVLRIVFWSRADQTCAWKVGAHEQRRPSRIGHERAWRSTTPSGRDRPPRLRVLGSTSINGHD